MKVGIVSDIHCNVRGLELALEAIGDVDELLCLGDAIFEYQFSNGVVALLKERGAHIIQGNHEEVFLSAAGGVGGFAIIRRHVIPNVVGPVVVYVTLTVPGVILTESFLSFLGLGVQEPLTSWGVLISEGANSMETAPWMLAFPAIFMAVTLFCFNFIGDGLRDALDPRDR